MKQREFTFRVIQNNELVGYEKLINGNWEWTSFTTDGENQQNWYRGVFPYNDGPKFKYHRHISTGLKDKNGKEIFEGDVLKYHFEDGTHDFLPVYFKDGAFMTGIKDSEYLSEDLDPIHDFKIEVAGNIFENPELLQP